MTGTVVTFYSYKGGVGRSFTLANTAVLLARWGFRVLTVDWDLEAPGLHHYFAGFLPQPPRGGVIDLATDFLAGRSKPRPRAVRLTLPKITLDLLAAGRQDEQYPGRVQSLDWADLYERGFAEFLERCRDQWVADYDFVLIDSRTGISDIAGICTAQLPDRLALVFTANEQSVVDAVRVAGLADQARDRLPYDRQPHLVLPILSRLDNRVEYQRAEEWQRHCARAVAPLFGNWLATTVTEDQMLRHLTLPYVSYWSFGEQLPVLEEPTPSADQISYALETVAAVLAQQFDRTDLLADNRDAYVAAARTREHSYKWDLLISSPRSALGPANALVEELDALDARALRSLSGDPGFLEQMTESARHLCLVVDGEVSRWQTTEAERFLRTALDGGGDRRLFCVLTPNTEFERLPAFLRNLRHLRLDQDGPVRPVARALHDMIVDAPPARADSDLGALRDAAAALRTVPGAETHQVRWVLIEQTVREMTAALDTGDTALLRDLTADLEVATRTRATTGRTTAPDKVKALIVTLLTRIDQWIAVFTH